MNIGNLLSVKRVFESQFPDATGWEVDIEQIGRATGHSEVLPASQALSIEG
jgi:hypothetical protein